MPATLPSNPDAVVIGAGIAAARRLVAAGRSVVVLEAGRRIGGRACTDTQAFGIPYDLGAAWLQGPADMPHIRHARRRGFTLLDHASPAETLFIGNRRATATERRRYAGTVERIGNAIARAGDVAVARRVDTTSPFAGAALAWLGALDHAVDYPELSTADVNALGPREANYLVREGLGTLVESVGARLPVRLGVAATCIRWGARDVRIETDTAGTLRARVHRHRVDGRARGGCPALRASPAGLEGRGNRAPADGAAREGRAAVRRRTFRPASQQLAHL